MKNVEDVVAASAEAEEDLVDYEEDIPAQGADVPVEALPKSSKSAAVKTSGYAGIHSSGFKDFLLKPELLRAVADCGFEHPSEVQHECIPTAILGMDVICQAKSGMGKTAVFVIAILQQLEVTEGKVGALVLCHTRELAYQICHEFERFSVYMPDLQAGVFYGGVSMKEQKETLEKSTPNVVIGTPGRINQLAKEGHLKLNGIRHFVLDECDKLLDSLDMRADVQSIFTMTPHDKQEKETLEKSTPNVVIGTPGRINQLAKEGHLKLNGIRHFVLDECDKLLDSLDMRADVQSIFTMTPHDKQVMMFSATLSGETRAVAKKFMKDPMEVFVDDEAKLTLHGLVQHYVVLNEEEKNRKLNDLLDALDFNQVVIFVKSVGRARELNRILCECNFPSICIHSGMKQMERLAQYKLFKEGKKRIMVATDLIGRGIDIERVNIVINYDMPEDDPRSNSKGADQYLHRVGRAGRFGTKGLAITFVSSEKDSEVLNKVQERFDVNIAPLPEHIDTASYMA